MKCPDLVRIQKNLVASLELGLTALGVDAVFTLCCDFIQVFFDTCSSLAVTSYECQ